MLGSNCWGLYIWGPLPVHKGPLLITRLRGLSFPTNGPYSSHRFSRRVCNVQKKVLWWPSKGLLRLSLVKGSWKWRSGIHCFQTFSENDIFFRKWCIKISSVLFPCGPFPYLWGTKLYICDSAPPTFRRGGGHLSLLLPFSLSLRLCNLPFLLLSVPKRSLHYKNDLRVCWHPVFVFGATNFGHMWMLTRDRRRRPTTANGWRRVYERAGWEYE